MRDFLRIQAVVFCSLLGAQGGAYLAVATFAAWALEHHRAEHPGEYVCGLFMLPYLFLGFLAGAIAGAITGWQVMHWLMRR